MAGCRNVGGRSADLTLRLVLWRDQPCAHCGCETTAARPQWLAQGIPRAAMSPAASGGRTVEPVSEEDF
jgi:hypothetical protein